MEASEENAPSLLPYPVFKPPALAGIHFAARTWKQVKANKGAPGMDGMTIDDFPAFAREHWERIRSRRSEGTYHPAPVRRVFIPKPDRSQRPLGVPTVLDCLKLIKEISQAVSLRSAA